MPIGFAQAHRGNGQIVNIPSYELKPGDVISLRPKSRDLEAVTDALEYGSRTKYSWVEVDKKTRSGKYLSHPEVDEIPEKINVQLIVELYSK